MILIDGIIFSLQRQGGISVYFKALIEYASEIKMKTEVFCNTENQEFTRLAKAIQGRNIGSYILVIYGQINTSCVCVISARFSIDSFVFSLFTL